MNENFSLPTSFKARELKQYSEPIRAADLEQGAIYFSLNYSDKDLLVPVLQPVVFIGKNLNPEDQGPIFYFQDVDSYMLGLRIDAPDDEKDAIFQSGLGERIQIYLRI